MDNVYQLNTHPISGMPMKPAEHRRSMTVLLGIIVIIGLACGIFYWINLPKSVPSMAPAAQPDTMRSEVAALLKSSPVHASQAEIDSVAALLTKSQVSASAADRAAVASELKDNR